MWPCCTYMYDAFIQDPWSWYMHVWCIYLCSSILDSDACVYDAHIYDPWSWYMHVSMFLDHWFMHVWCTNGSCIHDTKLFGDWGTNAQADSWSRMTIPSIIEMSIVFCSWIKQFKLYIPDIFHFWFYFSILLQNSIHCTHGDILHIKHMPNVEKFQISYICDASPHDIQSGPDKCFESFCRFPQPVWSLHVISCQIEFVLFFDVTGKSSIDWATRT